MVHSVPRTTLPHLKNEHTHILNIFRLEQFLKFWMWILNKYFFLGFSLPFFLLFHKIGFFNKLTWASNHQNIKTSLTFTLNVILHVFFGSHPAVAFLLPRLIALFRFASDRGSLLIVTGNFLRFLGMWLIGVLAVYRLPNWWFWLGTGFFELEPLTWV